MSPRRLPTTLLEAVRYFADLDVSNAFVAALRWPDGPRCPDCGHQEHSYITGKARFMHKKEHDRKITGSGTVNKLGVIGFKDRESGQVRASVLEGKRRVDFHPIVRANVKPGSMLYTDSNPAYTGGLEEDY